MTEKISKNNGNFFQASDCNMIAFVFCYDYRQRHYSDLKIFPPKSQIKMTFTRKLCYVI